MTASVCAASLGLIWDASQCSDSTNTRKFRKLLNDNKLGEALFAQVGMKLPIGVDSQSGLAHSAVVTAVNVHDKASIT